jgi:hypothetical protein
MSKQTRVRQARIPSVPELKPETKNGDAPNRKARRAAKPEVPQTVNVEISKAPHLLVELTGGRPNVRWVNGADPFAAPMHLEMAIEVVKDFIRKQLEVKA